MTVLVPLLVLVHLLPFLLLDNIFLETIRFKVNLIILLFILLKVFLSSKYWDDLRQNDDCLWKITWLFILFLGGVCYVGAVGGIGCTVDLLAVVWGIGCAVDLLVVVWDADADYWNEWLSPCLTYCFLLTLLSIPMLLVLNRLV